MAYVITQNCCNDASCVSECPVDCIRPSPDDPAAFAAAEMLYIDPDSCIDCGACMDACPVGAVSPEDELAPHLSRFAEFNAGYFLMHPLEPSPSAARPAKPDQDAGELSVAIIGAGPSGSYVAEELLERGNVRVTVYDSLPTPWGLLRSGVAPDHQHTKNLADLFEKTAARKNLSLRLQSSIGDDIALADVLGAHHAVVLATGAADSQPWTVPGADLPGVSSATDFVAWYNGHPDYADLDFDLSGERAVIVGNGNVALDMARVLLMTPEQLRATDIADHAIDALCASSIREVVILGRRGPLQAAYTTAEFHALTTLDGVDLVIDPTEADLDKASQAACGAADATYSEQLRATLAAEHAQRPLAGNSRRLVLRYLRQVDHVQGDARVESVAIAVNRLTSRGGRMNAEPTGATETIETGLVLASVGYRGRAVPGAPFDEDRGVIPNLNGRVVNASGSVETVPGLYASGWIRRGAQGGIGSSRLDAAEVVDHIVADFNARALPLPGAEPPSSPHGLGLSHWRAIDAHELEAGRSTGRPRVKLTSLDSLALVASARN